MDKLNSFHRAQKQGVSNKQQRTTGTYPEVKTVSNPPLLRLSLSSVCVPAVALPPEKTGSCCVQEKIQEKAGQSPTGLQKQLQIEVSVKLDMVLNHSMH